MRIVVLAGGLSPERDVSLSSGSLVANALMEKGHDVLLLDLYLGLANENVMFKTINMSSKYSYAVPGSPPDLEQLKSLHGSSLIGKNVIDICKEADATFLALHGDIGENGKLQAIFDVAGIRYTGTGYIGSLLAMDKDLTKKLLKEENIPTPDWKVIELYRDYERELENIKIPCVVKPCSGGSSVGVTIVDDKDQLKISLDEASRYGDRILIEQMVHGREFSCGILGGKALPVIEIAPVTGFYDYTNKYQTGLAKETCPAILSDEKAGEIQNLALKVHRILRLGYYSRIDFILDEEGVFQCLEANTLPGMTPTSLIPQEAKAMGIEYPELCEKIVQAANVK